jgi:hypothetical protein
MAVRKIPLREQPYIHESSPLNALAPSPSDKAEDPTVTLFQTRIRKTLLTDRALHDKVCPFQVKMSWLLTPVSRCPGSKSLCVLRTRILQA